MTPTSRAHARRRLLAVITAATAGVLAAIMLASPAAAHDTLISADPAADSTVDGPPEEISLTYSGALIDEGTGATVLEVTAPSGESVVEGAPVVNGAVVTQALTASDESGEFTVLWRVVSSDGHPISGEYSFTVAGGTPDGSPSPADSPAASESASPSESASSTPTPTAPEVAGPATGPPSPLPWVLLGIVAVAVVAGIVTLVVIRSRSARRGSGEGSETEPER